MADDPPAIEITDQEVVEIQAIMKESYGAEVTPVEAWEGLTSLVRLH